MQTRERFSGRVPRRYGCFDLSWGKARYTGSNRLVCDVTDGSDTWTGAMSVSDDGRWAACTAPTSRTMLIDGRQKSAVMLLSGVPTKLRWLARPEWIASLSHTAVPSSCQPSE